MGAHSLNSWLIVFVNLEFDLRSEFQAEFMLCAVIEVDEVSHIHAQADGSNIKLPADAGIHGAVSRCITEGADRVREAVADRAVRHAEAQKATLYGSEKPGVIRSED